VTGKRLVVLALEGMCKIIWGFPPTLIALMVDDMGTGTALMWFMTNMPRFMISRAVLGPVRVHLTCIITSLRNSCIYCAYGHAYALELIYLRDHGRLFPMNVGLLDDWLGIDPRVLRRRLHAVLVEAGLHAETIWADRIIALADGDQQPVDATEARIAKLMRMVTTMNVIANAADATPQEAHDPVNKNAAVKARHAALRAASST
jgi:hypothetical protein